MKNENANWNKYLGFVNTSFFPILSITLILMYYLCRNIWSKMSPDLWKCQRMEAVLPFFLSKWKIFEKHEHNSLTGQARKRCQNPVKNPFQKGSYFKQKNRVSSSTYILTPSGPIFPLLQINCQNNWMNQLLYMIFLCKCPSFTV